MSFRIRGIDFSNKGGLELSLLENGRHLEPQQIERYRRSINKVERNPELLIYMYFINM